MAEMITNDNFYRISRPAMGDNRRMRSFALFVAIVFALLAVPLVFTLSGSPPAPPQSVVPAPWDIEHLPEGRSRIFGVEPGRTPLHQARQTLGVDLDIALLIAPGESGSVEAYSDSFMAGPVTGKLILTLDTTQAQREAMLARAQKAEYMKGTTRRVSLAASDLLAIEDLPVVALTFIPSANLDAEIVIQRFGTPAERVRTNEESEHFLYPDAGLDLQLNAKSKEVLQYVAPRDFSRLREPLLAEKKG